MEKGKANVLCDICGKFKTWTDFMKAAKVVKKFFA